MCLISLIPNHARKEWNELKHIVKRQHRFKKNIIYLTKHNKLHVFWVPLEAAHQSQFKTIILQLGYQVKGPSFWDYEVL